MDNKHAVYDAFERFKCKLNEHIANNAPAVEAYFLVKKELADIKSFLASKNLSGLYVEVVLNYGVSYMYTSCPKNFVVNYEDAESWCNFFGIPPTMASVAKKQLSIKEVDWNQCQIKHYLKLKKEVEYLNILLQRQKDNLKQVEEITLEEMEFGKTLAFDHYYSNSDDINVYRHGSNRHKEVVAATKIAIEKNPKLIKVVEAVAASMGFSREFFTGK